MSHLPSGALTCELVRTLERKIIEHEKSIKRMVVEGCPTQAAEDLLRKLKATLQELKFGSLGR